MRTRIERLRVYLLVGAGLLVVVLGVFIGSARLLYRRHLLNLPNRLGVDIKSDSSGVTFSNAAGAKTTYTIHAAREVEHADGKLALHDVSIVLCGQKHDRQDRISGEDFEYDQKAGVVRALGLVHIDLQASQVVAVPANEAEPARARAADAPMRCDLPTEDEHAAGSADPKMLHATTRGLVYVRDLGVAATGEEVDFQLGQMTGHAQGADYNTDSGLLMLHAAVHVSGIAGGRPVELTAATADIRNQRSVLTHAKYVSLGQTVEADQATLITRPDGSLARIDGLGGVTMSERGSTLVGQRGEVVLDARSKPQTAVLGGGLLYTSDQPLRQARGKAEAATILFGGGQANHAVFTGAVQMIERTRATEAERVPWSVRELTAAKVEAWLVPLRPGKSQLRDAVATGDGHLTVVNNGSLTTPVKSSDGTSELRGDTLTAHLVAGETPQEPWRVDTVEGRGHTSLHQVRLDGIEETSTGDELAAKFRPADGLGRSMTHGPVAIRLTSGAVGGPSGKQAGKLAGNRAADTLLSAVQQGHVIVTRRVPARAATQPGVTPAVRARDEDVEVAAATRAAYDGDRDRVTLTGSAQLTDQGSVLWANQVSLDHATGDAQAEGAVKVNYVQTARAGAGWAAPRPGGSAVGLGVGDEPVHVLAERAEMNHAMEVATFYGRPARMWQGASQVQAPVIELQRRQRSLLARGDGTAVGAKDETAPVHTVIVSRGGRGLVGVDSKPEAARPGKSGVAAAKGGGVAPSKLDGADGATQVVRIASAALLYTDVLGTQRQAVFSGGVRVQSSDGTMLAREATAYLRPAGKAAAGEGASTGASPTATMVGTAPSAEGRGAGLGGAVSLDGSIERIVATGHIEMDQPGRHATGERLEYTAGDRLFLLTGDRAAPPRVLDTVNGTTVTGAALRFHSDDESVEALGAAPGEQETGQRVRTETPVKKR